MVSHDGAVLGIRLRRTDGFKFAVKGGREGLFIPSGVEAEAAPLLICEGPTDTAALLDLGFRNVVGRPSCTGGAKLLCDLTRRRRPSDVVIVADGDEPGRRGAGNLASILLAHAPGVRVIAPPEGIKDAREWLKAGGRREDVEKAIDAAPVRRLTVRVTIKCL
jgi:DNA primase